MGRQITQAHEFQERLVKLIPTEIVGAYMAISSVLGVTQGKVPNGDDVASIIFWMRVTVVTLFILTPLYLWRVDKVTKLSQLIATTISFVVWVYALGGEFLFFTPHINGATVILVLWTVAMPLIVKETDQARTLAGGGGEVSTPVKQPSN